jgi:hypothetical protein
MGAMAAALPPLPKTTWLPILLRFVVMEAIDDALTEGPMVGRTTLAAAAVVTVD